MPRKKRKASVKKPPQSPRQRNVVFLAAPHQTFQWRVAVTDMIFAPASVGREHQMVDLLMHEEFSKCVAHYQDAGKVKPETVFEFADMFVAAPELGGTRPQIHQVHVFDRRVGMVTSG